MNPPIRRPARRYTGGPDVTSSEQAFAADKANFLRLLTDRDDMGDVPVAIRLDIPHSQAQVMAPGVEDFDELRYACARFVENWLAPEIDRLHAHLEWKASQ